MVTCEQTSSKISLVILASMLRQDSTEILMKSMGVIGAILYRHIADRPTGIEYAEFQQILRETRCPDDTISVIEAMLVRTHFVKKDGNRLIALDPKNN